MKKSRRNHKRYRRTRKQKGAGGKWFGLTSSNKEKKNTPPAVVTNPPAQQQPLVYQSGFYPPGNFPTGFYANPPGFKVYPNPTPQNPNPQPYLYGPGQYPPTELPNTEFPGGFLAYAPGFIQLPVMQQPTPVDPTPEQMARVKNIVEQETKKQKAASNAMAKMVKNLTASTRAEGAEAAKHTRQRHRKAAIDHAKMMASLMGESEENAERKAIEAENKKDAERNALKQKKLAELPQRVEKERQMYESIFNKNTLEKHLKNFEEREKQHIEDMVNFASY